MPLSRITDSSISNNSITIEDFASARDSAIYSPAANVVAIRTADTERMRVNSTGNTFIGVTGAVWDERLGVRPITGTGQVGIGVYSSNTSYASSCIRVQTENGTGANWYLYEGRGQGGAVNYWVNGNGLIYTGQGIEFPATQVASANANTLDDYEEGTWTPTISIEGGSGALSATSIYDARYTKIGRLVHVTCDVAWSNYYANGGTGAVLFTGLPFAYAKGGTQGEGQLMQGGYWTSSNITGSRFSSELIWHTFFNTSGSTGGYIKYKESSTDRGSYLALGGGPLGTGSGSLVFQFEFTYVAAT